MLLYPHFYRLHGVRRWTELATPRISTFAELELPKDTVLHYMPKSEVEYGIEPSDPLVARTDRFMFVDHVRDITEREGNPMSNRIPAESLVRKYHQRFRRFRRLKKLDTALRDPKSLLVVNYALLGHLYRYRPSIYARYNQWANIQATLWQNMNTLMEQAYDQQHFVSFELPRQLPTLADFKKAEANLNKTTLEPFKGPRYLTLLDFWQWLGEDRSLSKLSAIELKKLRNINVVFTAGTRWIMINLGWLNDQRKPVETETVMEDHSGDKDPTLVQKHFLRSMMTLFETGTVIAGDSDAEQTPEQNEEKGEEKEEPKEISEQELDEQLNELERLKEFKQNQEIEGGIDPVDDFETPTPEKAVERQLHDLAERGLVSGADYRRLERAIERSKELPNPFGEGTLEQFSQVTKEDVALDPKTTRLVNTLEGVMDEGMLNSSVNQFDPQYVQRVMKKDIVGMVLNAQRAGATVSDYRVKEVRDAINDYEVHSVRFTPVSGAPSTVHFRMPVVKEDGTFIADGVKYRLSKQRSDVPIRKVSPNRVALTSYYGKIFVERTERKTNNYERWLNSKIVALGMDDQNEAVTKMRLTSVFDHNLRLPRTYSALSKKLKAFISGDYEFYLDYKTRKDVYGEALVDEAEKDGMVFLGRTKNTPLVMDMESTVYEYRSGKFNVLGRVEELIGYEHLGQPPLECADLKLFNKSVPMGLALGYLMGIDRLIDRLGLEPRRVNAGGRLDLTDDEFVVRFKDESLIFPRSNVLAQLIFSGFNRFHRQVKEYTYREFTKRPVYANVLEANGLQVRYAREIDLLDSLFVDPITKELLTDMREPVTFLGLMFRSCELLLTDWHPDENNMEYQRIRGYERFAGAVYSELVRSLRSHNSKPANPNKKIELNPEAVWMTINKDSSKRTIEDSNPLQNLRHKEELTFAGTGGRSNESMVARTRVYHPNDMGVVSESTKDSGDVAITTFLSPDANLESLRGTTRRFNKEKDGATSLLSTSALLAPAADRDDPKRVNFIAIQQAQGISAKGYSPTPLRTGYERVLAHRTDDLFAYTAKQDGKVISVTDEYVEVEYKDGARTVLETGRRYGTAAGSVYPHSVKAAVKEGARFKAGEVITYNENFFELDPIDPKQAVWKAGVMVRTALAESSDTLEDSSAISTRVAKALETDSTEVREIRLAFDQTLHNLVKPGTSVGVESILCNIENPVTSDSKLFDDEALETLQLLSAQSPKAKKFGTVERIEVFYNGDKSDMSESLRKAANASDREFTKRNKAQGGKALSGQVDNKFKVGSQNLELDNAVVRIYITGPASAGVGDKGVFANQMKTVFGRIMEGVNETEDGQPIDAIFGYKSIADRLTNSPEIMGTTNALLKTLSLKVVEKYRGK